MVSRAPLLLLLSASLATSPRALMVLATLWLLPDWVGKWIDVWDRWKTFRR